MSKRPTPAPPGGAQAGAYGYLVRTVSLSKPMRYYDHDGDTPAEPPGVLLLADATGKYDTFPTIAAAEAAIALTLAHGVRHRRTSWTRDTYEIVSVEDHEGERELRAARARRVIASRAPPREEPS